MDALDRDLLQQVLEGQRRLELMLGGLPREYRNTKAVEDRKKTLKRLDGASARAARKPKT